MTKKEFKEFVRDQTYTGWNGHRIRINAFFFDWKTGSTADNKYFGGYKFRVSANAKLMSKKDLFELLYKLVNNIVVEVPWFVTYRFAATDEQRFKIPLSL